MGRAGAQGAERHHQPLQQGAGAEEGQGHAGAGQASQRVGGRGPLQTRPSNPGCECFSIFVPL